MFHQNFNGETHEPLWVHDFYSVPLMYVICFNLYNRILCREKDFQISMDHHFKQYLIHFFSNYLLCTVLQEQLRQHYPAYLIEKKTRYISFYHNIETEELVSYEPLALPRDIEGSTEVVTGDSIRLLGKEFHHYKQSMF